MSEAAEERDRSPLRILIADDQKVVREGLVALVGLLPGITNDLQVHIGADLRIKVIAVTPRCAVPTLAHGPGIPRDPAALRVVADHNRVP